MRITHSHLWSWPEVRRGAERELHDLTLRQAAAGNQVRVVSGTRNGVITRGADGPVRVTRLRVPKHHRFTDEALWAVPALPGLAATRGDLMHAWHYGDGAAATFVRRGRPLVLKITGCVPRDAVELRRPDRALLHRALENASEVWVNDDWVVHAMAAWGVPMVVVPPGVDTVAFHPDGERSSRPTALAVGPLDEPRKRLSVLVQLWRLVLEQVPDAQLRIAGAGTEEQQAALLLPLPARVRESVVLLGSVPDLRREHQAAWVFAAPAGDEAFGLAVVEALATGTPVVGTDTGATPGLLTGAELGSVHPLEDPESMAAALVGRLQRPPSALESTTRAAAVRGHSWESRMAQIDGRYRALLGA